MIIDRFELSLIIILQDVQNSPVLRTACTCGFCRLLPSQSATHQTLPPKRLSQNTQSQHLPLRLRSNLRHRHPIARQNIQLILVCRYTNYQYQRYLLQNADYSFLKSVDVKSFGSLVGLGKLALFAQKDNNK